MEKAHISEFEYNRHEIERALFFLSNALQDSGHNTKPVLLHSIQVAGMLWESGYPQDVVTAAILHDVVEDTDITVEDVRQSFGRQVALYVDVLTISDTQDVVQSFVRTAELGGEALSIRVADLIENSHYYTTEGDPAMNVQLHDNYKLFMDMSKDLLEGTHIYMLLLGMYDKNVKPLIESI